MNVRRILSRMRSSIRLAFYARADAGRPAIIGGQAIAPQARPNVVRLADLNASDSKKYVVFFAPEAGVVPHYIAHCVVAKTLEDRGHATLIVRCFDVYPRCVVMDGDVLPHDLSAEQRNAVCVSCNGLSSQMTGAYDLNVIDLQELVDEEIKRKVEALTANLPKDLSTFEVDGVRLGQICGAEAAVTFKTVDFAGETPAVRRLLIWYLEGALLSYFAMQRLLDSGKIARVVHFSSYAILLAAALAATMRGVEATFMTMASRRGVDRRRIVFIDQPLLVLSYRHQLEQWPRWRELYLSAEIVKDVADDCLFRMAGNSVMVYSPSRTGSTDGLFTRLRLSAGRKLLVAFTSSLDEIAANSLCLNAVGAEPFTDRQPFRDQIDWLQVLIERVEASSDMQLVVRIHPREGANRREHLVSSHLGQLRAQFDREYQHVRFVWPGENISSYDLMELADVGLTGWSSTALEMARFGVPTLIAFDQHTPLPLGDVVEFSPTRDGYFDKLHELLEAQPSLDLIRFAYRWTHLHILGNSVDLGDVIPDADCDALPPFHPPAAGAAIEAVLVEGKLAIDINHQRLLVAQRPTGALFEQDALRKQLRRALWLICTGLDRTTDYRLCYREGAADALSEGCDAVLSNDGEFVEFRAGAVHVRRRSRMAQRLGVLAANYVDQLAVS